jgi:hypothetical protein
VFFGRVCIGNVSVLDDWDVGPSNEARDGESAIQGLVTQWSGDDQTDARRTSEFF